MKKIGLLMMTLLLAFSLVGCQSASSVRAVENAKPLCAEQNSAYSLTLPKSGYHIMPITVSEDRPYWGMLLQNTGSSPIRIELDRNGQIVSVEPGQKMWIYNQELFQADTYEVSFSSADMNEMSGLAEFWCVACEKAVTVSAAE